MRQPAVLGAVLLVGVVVGEVLRRWLSRRTYRLPEEGQAPERPTWWVTPLAAVGGVGLWWALAPRQSWVAAAAYAATLWVMVALAAIDLDVHRLPDAIQLPAYPVLSVLLAAASWTVGSWSSLGRAAVAAVALLAIFLLLALVGGGMGLGDVKLAGLLGLLLGWLSWAHVLMGVAAGLLLGGVVGVALLVTRTAGRKAEFAYGPPLLAGAALAVLALPVG